MSVHILIKRGEKHLIEAAKASLKKWEQVYATDSDQIGIYDGTNIRWQSNQEALIEYDEISKSIKFIFN